MSASLDLFAQDVEQRESLGEGACVLRGFALADEVEIAGALNDITQRAPFRHMITPNGFRMSVAMSNCGRYGWVSDQSGYRYDSIDPESGSPWPHMPKPFVKLAQAAAASAGFEGFVPDACLINRYAPGARLSLHQDKNERDFDAPIVSVSLGVPATFLFGGLHRQDKNSRVPLRHGDVVIWGGAARLRYHGVSALKQEQHSFAGAHRINLTFRKAG
jgi:alkylated DNA repair protein (DNA oxidative demethylase)